MTTEILKKINFEKLAGLIPAIIQDWQTKQVLMLAFMNKDALEKTLETKTTWFWSRTRKELWNKGETSGNFQIVKEIYLDCDNDSLLILVDQKNGKACHTGKISCFFKKI
ncbi:phosphoribosyl-AMP cyclohydrolase [Patescibacteria group bacterium]|nr:phosphoribosyl-AMP cyclohydrolase [Patescibacteria group bacterium]MBU4512111.1 phosphoribosyl-AMP cyclohydrolase [Patescibacteria group bacterium]MCG2694355.1 phosphoribosyl-AMP cyclohydrolase [Candidatus Parcubacteria bacterium]